MTTRESLTVGCTKALSCLGCEGNEVVDGFVNTLYQAYNMNIV